MSIMYKTFYCVFTLIILTYDVQQFADGNMGLGTYILVNFLCVLFGMNLQRWSDK